MTLRQPQDVNKYVKRLENPQHCPLEVARTIPKGYKHFATFDTFKGSHTPPKEDMQ